MCSPVKVTDYEIVTSIPPVICNNPREKIEAQQVVLDELLKYQQRSGCIEAIDREIPSKLIAPIPRYPLSIEWSPSVMFFEITNTFISQKIRIWNACSRPVYVHCCGLWGDNARLGATWRIYPRTRFLLSPGLTANLIIQAMPKDESPVSSAQIAIQLAAGHKRDPVVGYFVIPVIVKFQRYIQPCVGEEASIDNIN